jgi:ribosomal protein S18 acetylase RimI-like enzyme
MSEVTCRALKGSDRGKIGKAVQECYAELKVQSWADAVWWRELEGHDEFVFEDPVAFRHTWIAARDGKEVGFGSYDPKFARDTAFITCFCILPEHQRKGIGKQLMHFLLQQMTEERVSKVFATLHMHPFFLPAYYAFQSFNFEVVDSSPQYNVQKLSLQLKL